MSVLDDKGALHSVLQVGMTLASTRVRHVENLHNTIELETAKLFVTETLSCEQSARRFCSA